MKANLRKKKLLPLSRATWSVLHDRHYFHHHRHRPQNCNLFTAENKHPIQIKRLHSTSLGNLPKVNDLEEQDYLNSHQALCHAGYTVQQITHSKRFSHTLRRQNKIECKYQSSTLSRTSRSSNDPGARDAISKYLHLHLLSNLRITSGYSPESISSRKRYMCGQSSFVTWRNSSEVNSTSDLSFQIVCRPGLISIPSRKLEVAEFC